MELQDRLVFALHPHQSVFNLPAEAVLPIPDGVLAARAVLAANMETALNAAWDAAPAPADKSRWWEPGVVGSLVAWLVRSNSRRESDPGRCRANPRRPRATRSAWASPRPARRAPDCDLVVHASGTAAGLATALGLAGDEATVLEMSWYGAGEVAIPLGGAFHSRRLKLVSSQVGRVAPSHRARWSFRRRLAAALELLADSRLDALVAPPVGFHELPPRLPDILARESGVLCQLVAYPAAL